MSRPAGGAARSLISRGARALLGDGVLAEVIDHEPGAQRGHDEVADLMRVAARKDLFAARGITKAGLPPDEHHRRMHRRHQHEAVVAAHAPDLAEEEVEIGDVLEHQAGEHAVERAVFEGQRQGQIVAHEGDGFGTFFGARLREHAFGKIERGDARALARQAQRMAAGATADVQNVEAGGITQPTNDLGLFQSDEWIPVCFVNFGPAVVSGRRGQDLSR